MSSVQIAGDDAVNVSVVALLKLVASSKKMVLHKGQIKALQSGDYLSSLKGRGMEFDESRLYQPGDDVRHLDWRVTARTGKAHSKLFRQEQERPVFLWVDHSVSMRFATRGKFKSVLAAEIASLLAWNASERGDRIGGVVFSEHMHHETKPKRGKAAVLRLMHLLANDYDNSLDVQLQDVVNGSRRAMLRLRRLAKPGSLMFLISDFRCFDDVAESQLVQLSRHSDVILVLVYDPLEMELPPGGQYQISNGQQQMVIDSQVREFVVNYRQKFIDRQSHLQYLARMCRTPFISCSTVDDPAEVLQHQLNANSR